MLPMDLIKPDSLLFTAFVGIGLALGAAIVYVRKNLMTPTQAKPTDLIVAGGSFFDHAKLDDLKSDMKRIAVALEELVRLRRADAEEERMEERMTRIFERLARDHLKDH